MADLLKLVSELDSYRLLTKAYPEFAQIANVETLLSQAQAAASLTGATGVEEQFIQEATLLIREACDFVDSSTNLINHESLIRKLSDRDIRQDRLSLFTTNYDLALETAIQNLGFTAIDGFGYGSKARFSGRNFQHDIVHRDQRGEISLAPNVVRLLKLHGSVDWNETSDGILRSTQPDNPVLIYPSTNKYQQSYRQPFLEAITRFQAGLRKSETSVVVVGFGFNDDHLTQPIVDALLGDPSVRVLVVAPDALSVDHPTYNRLRQAAAHGDGRITLVGATLEQFVTILPDRSDPDPWQLQQQDLARIWTGK